MTLNFVASEADEIRARIETIKKRYQDEIAPLMAKLGELEPRWRADLDLSEDAMSAHLETMG